MVSYRVIGQAIGRYDGPDKVTGKGHYTADFQLPGTLWGKCLRSPFSHARIKGIDITKAKAVPGVYAVITGQDTKGVRYGRRLYDVPPLAEEEVHFIGERVAAVAAEDEDIAQKAIDLIEIEYEELPALFDPEVAMQDGAPLVHADMMDYKGYVTPPDKPSNIFSKLIWGKGDVEVGFAEADVIVENTFTTPLQHQGYLETNTALVWIDDAGRIQMWTSVKTPYNLVQQMSDAMSIPKEQFVVNHAYIGGDFGGKGSPIEVPVCYFLAKHSGRPVRMVMDYVEEFMASNPRHSTILKMKTGVKKDGTLTAHSAQVIFNSGAYGGFKPLVNLTGAAEAGGGAYRIPNTYAEAIQVYTHTIPGGHMRGPGEPQAIYALECQLDLVAREIGMEAVEFRMHNLINDGEETAIGHHWADIRVKETLQAAVEASDYNTPKPANVGRGVAVGDRPPGGGETHAVIHMKPDGTVVLNTPIFEQGSGTYTMLQQIVAEEFKLPLEAVTIEIQNMDFVPYDTGVGGSRVTRVASETVYNATQEVRQALIQRAAESLGWPEEQMEIDGADLVHTGTNERQSWSGVLSRTGESVAGAGHIKDASRSDVTGFAAQVAEVSVDPETGEVTLLRMTTAHDVGTIMNPIGHQGQINGGLMMGVGYALMEEMKTEEGRISTLSFGDYKMPSIMDAPDLKTVLLPSESGVGHYRVKGIGENSKPPVAPAIANAIHDAIGVRVRSLPITAEKVYKALQEKNRA